MDNGVIELGVIGRNSLGEVVVAAVSRCHTNWFALMAELTASRLGCRDIIAEGDALGVIKLLQSKEKDRGYESLIWNSFNLCVFLM